MPKSTMAMTSEKEEDNRDGVPFGLCSRCQTRQDENGDCPEPNCTSIFFGLLKDSQKPEIDESILRKYTYADLAKRCNPSLSRRHVSRVLKGQCINPSIAVMRNLANALEISVDDLEDELSKIRGPEIYKGGDKVTKEVEQQIRGLKDEEGMTTRTAAEIAGVSRMTVSMIWNSKEENIKEEIAG